MTYLSNTAPNHGQDVVLCYGGYNTGYEVTHLEEYVTCTYRDPDGDCLKPTILEETYHYRVLFTSDGRTYPVYFPIGFVLEDAPQKEQYIILAYLTLFYEEGVNYLGDEL